MIKTTNKKIPNHESYIVELYKTILPYKWSILFIVIVTILSTYSYLYFIPSTYESKAIIKIKINKNRLKTTDVLRDSINTTNTVGIKQEILALQTFNLNSRVLKEVDFSIQYFQKKNYKSIELYENTPISIKIDDKLSKILYHKIKLIPKNSSFTLYTNELGESKEYPFNKYIKTPYFSGKVIKKIPFSEEIQIVFNGTPRQIYEKIIKKRLKVTQLDPDANLVQISFQDTIPKRANRYVNSLIKIYIEDSLKKKGDINQKILSFLNMQIESLKKKLEKSEEELENYKEYNSIEPNIQLKDSFSKLSDIDLELSELTLKEKLAKNLLTFVLNNRNLDAIGPTLLEFNDQATIKLIDTLERLQAQEEDLKTEYTDRYPKLISIRKKIKRIKSKILLNIKNLKSTLTTKRISLEKQKEKYEKILKNLPQKENKLISLKRDYEVNSKMYTYLLEKKSENELIRVAVEPDYEVVDQAYTSDIPVKPKRLMLLIASAIVGFLLAIFVSLIRALLIDKVTTQKEVQLMSRLPIYGVIPFYKNALFATTQLKEAYHKLATNLHVFKHEEEGNVIIVTSKIEAEGKTTTVVSLAGAFQNANFKTIIVDLNLKNPTLHAHFGIAPQYAGVSTYLSQRDNIGNIIYTTDYNNLDIVPAGPVPPNPYELLLSNRLHKLFDFLKARYDYIIVDTASYDNAIETLAIMKLATMNLVIIQEGISKKSTLVELENIARERGITNIGIVLKSIAKEEKQKGEHILANNNTIASLE